MLIHNTTPLARRGCFCLTSLILLMTLSGCAAMRPLKGIPAGDLPDDYRIPIRSARKTIDLSLLRQTPPREHLVDTDDVLGVYIEGILGGRREAPPVRVGQGTNLRSSLGYPIHVRRDGTISLPLTKPVFVRGMTIGQVEAAIRQAYTGGEKPQLVAGKERILVDLQRPRNFHVLVIRQEAGDTTNVAGASGRRNFFPTSNANKRGMGRVVSLPVYQNDVLHALMETGGLPGLDAENIIYVIRRRRDDSSPQKTGRSPRRAAPTPSRAAPSPRRIGPSLRRVMPEIPPAPAASEERAPQSSTPEPAPQTLTPELAPPDSSQPPLRWELSQKQRRSSYRPIRLIRGQSPETPSLETLGGHSGPPPITDRTAASVAQNRSEKPSRFRRFESFRPKSFRPRDSGRYRPTQRVPYRSHTTVIPPHRAGSPIFPSQGGSYRSAFRSLPGPSPRSTIDRTLPATMGSTQPWRRHAFPANKGGFPEHSAVISTDHDGFPLTDRRIPALKDLTAHGSNVVRIPLRMYPGEKLSLNEEDITLKDGDIVYIESRETDVFFTGGLLGGGRYLLPRDQDLDILQALAIVQAQANRPTTTRAIGGISAINQDVTVGASHLIVLRRLENGGQVAIDINLYLAMRSLDERIFVKPGDHLILQYTRMEAVAAFFERHILDGLIFGASTGIAFGN